MVFRPTEAFLILAGVMQGDTLAPHLFLIAIDYILTKAMEGHDFGFTLHQQRSRRYPLPAVKITDADFEDDLALLTNTIAEAQIFLLSLEDTANSIGFHQRQHLMRWIRNRIIRQIPHLFAQYVMPLSA